jgi:hypothetical protein
MLKNATRDTHHATRITQQESEDTQHATVETKEEPRLQPPLAPPSKGGGSDAHPPPAGGGVRGGGSDSSSILDAPVGELQLSAVRAKWNAFIRAVDEKNHSLPFILKICHAEETRGSTLVIRFQYPFHRDKVLTDTKHRRVVEECAREIFGVKDLMLEGIIGEDAERKEVRSTDMVTNILKAFGGSVVE